MTSHGNERNLTLVTGSSGTTGRRVARRLAGLGVPTRLGSRSGQPPFDWADESTWQAVLENVGAAYLVYYPDLVAPGAVDVVRRFAAAAVSAGVRRLVLLSGRGEEAAREAERAVMAAGAEWTVVRCAFFAQNFSEKGFEDFVRAGTVALPAPEVGEPFVDAEDIADVVVAALTEDGHAGQLYELTGPRLLTFEESIAEIAKATGRNLDYHRISADEFITGLVGLGIPREEAEVFAEIFGTVLDGRNAVLTDGVQRALGRPPRDFSEYAGTAAATGVWNG
ncbi:MAG TPA: NmrA family NAD(P)-binding protein [Pseudonocardia sp.]|nr:NmrA family NAD(P)-binding protein [Pseudonocardia sp.]